MTDAFRDAELLAEAIDAGFAGRAPLTTALANYERRRYEAARPDFSEALARAAFQPFSAMASTQRSTR